MMCVDGSNNFGGALCIMYEYLLSCIVFHEKEYKDKLCCAASYIEIYMIYMCICVFFLSEVAIISKLYFNLLDRSFVLITIQFDIINFFLIYSNTILKNSMHIALTKSIFKKRSILWCYTASQDDTFSCDILDLHSIPMLKYRPVKKIDWASSS